MGTYVVMAVLDHGPVLRIVEASTTSDAERWQRTMVPGDYTVHVFDCGYDEDMRELGIEVQGILESVGAPMRLLAVF